MKTFTAKYNNDFINSLLGTYIELSALECNANESFNYNSAGNQYIDIETIERAKQETAMAIVEIIVDYQIYLNDHSDETVEFDYFKNQEDK